MFENLELKDVVPLKDLQKDYLERLYHLADRKVSKTAHLSGLSVRGCRALVEKYKFKERYEKSLLLEYNKTNNINHLKEYLELTSKKEVKEESAPHDYIAPGLTEEDYDCVPFITPEERDHGHNIDYYSGYSGVASKYRDKT